MCPSHHFNKVRVLLGEGGGGEAYSVVACLSRLTSGHASRSRRSTVSTPIRDASGIWALTSFFFHMLHRNIYKGDAARGTEENHKLLDYAIGHSWDNAKGRVTCAISTQAKSEESAKISSGPPDQHIYSRVNYRQRHMSCALRDSHTGYQV